MKQPTLWIKKAKRWVDWRFWLAIHLAALIIQIACLQASPIVMQKANAVGWWALCVTAKGP